MDKHRLLRVSSLWFMVASGAVPAFAGDSATTFDGGNVTLTLGRFDADGTQVTLDSDGLAHYFSQARCLCPTNVIATVSLDTTAVSALGAGQADVSLVVGNDCSNINATDCTTLGQNLTLTGSKTASSSTLATSSIFKAALGSSSCGVLSATSNRLWAIVRVGGSRLDNPPSLAIGLGAASAPPPTNVSTKVADEGLAVSWSPPSDVSGVSGYQVLCSPVAAKPTSAAYEICTEALPATTGVFATLDTSFVCSALVPVGQSSVRVSGLQNGTTYEVAVVTVGNDGFPGVPSKSSTNTPAPTVGFEDLYRAEGGTAVTGCSMSHSAGAGRAGTVLLVALVLAWRRARHLRLGVRPCVRMLPWVTLALVSGGPAWAGWDEDIVVAPERPNTQTESPRTWNVELRLGPYRPEVDSELAERGKPERPFAEMFGSSRHLMSQLEIDRQVSHVAGTLAVGFGVGYFKVSAAALGADGTTRTGDSTSLRLIPLSLSAVYRADFLPPLTTLPFVPFAKAGLDCGLWSLADSSHSGSSDGVTLGWHAAVGVAMSLDFLDPEAARALDRDAGVNHVAIFFEWGRYALNGLGSADRLRVGDTTWLGGVMLEL